MKTYDQKMAEQAFKCVNSANKRDKVEEYRSFALSFPSLVHSCGLVQAVAFAEIKNRDYLKDLVAVLNEVEKETDLASKSREAQVVDYMRISRHALSAASWLKRYVQAIIGDKKEGN
ncbi:hypothetical protein AGMMS50276_00170 [Synergistales bacterium]|nr:hypothetical protein AGMMS50276_00170 [Synergistales bacterium]